MVFIIGGSYQGKLDFARERFDLDDSNIQICTEATDAIDPSRRCVAYLDRYALNRVRAGEEPLAGLDAHRNALRDAVLISTDISCGVVPVDATLRTWREACGRMNNALAARADEVWRLFCGLPQRLK